MARTRRDRRSRGSGGADGDTEEVITVPELAELLRLSINKTYDAVAKGEIPGAVKIGGSIRVSRTVVIAWLRQGRVSRSEGGNNR